ncbi:MAG: gliding motility lipoprotein GldH [Bacteroidales bacterium]|nr:gliding motility lipoprotein GldH [Bacteroidales bacterium]
MKKENNISFLIPVMIILTSACLNSCNPANIYADSEKIPGYTWNASNTITFEVPVNDTINAYDINLIIRTDKSYPYRNLFLFIKTTSPQEISIKDTLEYYLADEKGYWYGSGLGDVNDLSVPFKTNILFPDEGIYTFSIQHGMRDQNLDGVTDIGIQIRKRKR